MNKTYLALFFFLLLAALTWMPLTPVRATAPVQTQLAPPVFHRDCPAGQMRNASGVCTAMATVLSGVRYVRTDGSDSNAGTTDSAGGAWLTINKCATTLTAGQSCIIHSGTYRETISPANSGTSTSNYLTYACYTGDTCIVSGADIKTGWTLDGSDYRLDSWTALSYTTPDGSNATADYLMQTELVVYDGVVMMPVVDRASLTNGKFFVDRAASKIYARFTGGANPSGHTVEVSARQTNFNDNTKTFLRVIGLTFQYHATKAGSSPGGLGYFGNDCLLEENIFQWNNATGLWFGSSRGIFKGNKTNNNGQMGFGSTCDNCLIEDQQVLNNNWKGYDANWEAGGGKMVFTDKSIFRRWEIGNNDGPGLWFDIDNYDNLVENCWGYNNMEAAFKFELRSNRNILRNSLAFGSRVNPGNGYAVGILITSSNNNLIVNNTVWGNLLGGIAFPLDNRVTPGSNNNYVFNNVLTNNNTGGGSGSAEIGLTGGPSNDGLENCTDVHSNHFDGNVIYSLVNTAFHHAFYVECKVADAGSYAIWVDTNNIATWRTEMQKDGNLYYDQNSQHADPLLVNNATSTGWHLQSGSPAIAYSQPVPLAATSLVSLLWAPFYFDYDDQIRSSTVGFDGGADHYKLANRVAASGRVMATSRTSASARTTTTGRRSVP